MRVLVEGGVYTLAKETGETRVIQEGEEIAAVAAEFFGPSVLPAPEAVTARQARLALLGAGKLAMVEGALAQIPGVQGEAARIEWEYATDIRRDSPLIGALAPMLGLTSEQVDGLFRAAAGL